MRTGTGDYPLVCPHLVRALASRGLWTDDVRAYLQRSRGTSVFYNVIVSNIVWPMA